ncbi:MAG: hypothetical protein AAF063_30275 [Cyanobacteria bacterium J06643_5]
MTYYCDTDWHCLKVLLIVGDVALLRLYTSYLYKCKVICNQAIGSDTL